MIINVFSLRRANEVILSDVKFQKNWISIRDKDYPELYKYVRAACKNVLSLEFDDVTHYTVKHNLIHPIVQEAVKTREYIYFDENMARKILHFALDIYNKNEELNIHCFAGRSRSQAVGYALNIYFNLFMENNEEHFHRNLEQCNERFMPNTDVLQIMNKVLFLGDSGYVYFK